VNQHATTEEEVFSVGAASRLYNEDLKQIELELRYLAVVVRRTVFSSRVGSAQQGIEFWSWHLTE
jgi:hypothetical protein